MTGKEIALKKIKLENEPEGVPSTALREISVLRELRQPGVVRLLDVLLADSKIFLVFEYMHMDLKRLMDLTKGPLRLDLVKPWLDNKHTVFGRVVRGMEVVQNIGSVKTNPKTDKPYDDIRIISITIK